VAVIIETLAAQGVPAGRLIIGDQMYDIPQLEAPGLGPPATTAQPRRPSASTTTRSCAVWAFPTTS
jgi:hypothetical protein